MEGKKIFTLLGELHNEITKINSIDEQGQALLQDIDHDIQQLLQRSGNLERDENDLAILHLGDSIRHFEVTHPTLTATLSKLMAVLSNAGI
jgi:hypothetical protein